MADLKPCPCGKTPEALQISPGSGSKYAYVSGLCCGEWEIEFRTDYEEFDTNICMMLAEAAWNEAPRPIEDTKDATIERMRGLLEDCRVSLKEADELVFCDTYDCELVARIDAELKEGE